MKTYTFLFFAFLLVSSCAEKAEETTTETTETMETAKKQLRHVVLFKLKDSTTTADIEKVKTAFAALPSQIEEIKGFEWGLNNSSEGLDKGYTHCFLLTFDSEEGRAAYLPHPAHKAFGDILTPYLEDVLVVDYWTTD
ncbi:Dabb family protein [Flammeovirgaceae bacterium SG7u.111]|nr:Dabb family protein [Flammeovirgaceae bacterium SG7u.132]WPO37225.1 Dabb family protein [Flammeovirgaceae bacterium SG7u.111]